MGKRKFGELEAGIVRIVQSRGKASVQDVFAELGSGSYTTVMTVMARLAEKKELIREKDGKRYLYRVAPEGSPSARSFFARWRDKVFDGSKTAFISCLLESDPDISEEELKEMEEMIRSYRKGKKHG